MRTLAVLGSTGSIGLQTLDVVDRSPGEFRVTALAAATNHRVLLEQVAKYRPDVIAVADPASRDLVSGQVDCEVVDSAAEIAEYQNDVVVNAVVGFAGLESTLGVLRRGGQLALANKESLVAAGELVMATARKHNATLVPVDSEHASAHMCRAGEAKRLILTASGGPFHGRTDLDNVTPAEALKHPTWEMGGRITVDSATLVNKGLEVIEAHHLFGLDYDQIEVVVHPQSVLHCIAEFADGSFLSALGPPDMRVPIAYALGRVDWRPDPVDWTAMQNLTFDAPDVATFPALTLAYAAGRAAGAAPLAYNAADEVAVAAFVEGRIRFTDIPAAIEGTLNTGDFGGRSVGSYPEAVELDAEARNVVETVITHLQKAH